MGAIKAVFRSWDNPRAIYYRRMNDIPSDWGTAVNVPVSYTHLDVYKRQAKGTGALYIRPGLPLPPFLCGGGQESNYRSGTRCV